MTPLLHPVAWPRVSAFSRTIRMPMAITSPSPARRVRRTAPPVSIRWERHPTPMMSSSTRPIQASLVQTPSPTPSLMGWADWIPLPLPSRSRIPHRMRLTTLRQHPVAWLRVSPSSPTIRMPMAITSPLQARQVRRTAPPVSIRWERHPTPMMSLSTRPIQASLVQTPSPTPSAMAWADWIPPPLPSPLRIPYRMR